jgi:phosphatidylglycerol:prolipoprotein diacylglycerol transferase
LRPVLFRVGPIEIRAYGTLLMLGFLAAIWLSARQGKRRGIEAGRFLDLAIWVLVAGLVGARATFVALDPVTTWRDMPYLWQPGLSWYGGLGGGVIAALLYSRVAHLSFASLADSCAPGVALGYGIARIGCFLNGCCYGAPTNLPWGVRFGPFGQPSHPTQLYDAAGSWAIMGVLLYLSPRLKRPGRLFAAYLALYGVLRFLVEILRKGYTAEVLINPLTQAQVASIALVIASLVVFWRLGKGERHSGDESAAGR